MIGVVNRTPTSGRHEWDGEMGLLGRREVALRDSGALTDEEFAREKTRILGA
jgi:hypothetical protein